MKPLLKATGLTKVFGPGCPACRNTPTADFVGNICPRCQTVLACREVSFELFANEVLGVVGESGSGKSTLVRLLNFEWQASSGSLVMNRDILPPRIAGQIPSGFEGFTGNLLELSQFQQRLIRNALMGIVYQNPYLGLRMGVSSGGNIAERLLGAGWRHIGRMRERSGDLLDKTEIPTSRMDEPPKNFSGGMQQRVQIAKALSNNPIILLLDEVTTGLDLSVQARVLDLIRGLQREFGLSMLVVSHDLGIINLLCHRTMVMKHGQVVESGLTDQVLQDPQHSYTQLLVASRL